MKVKLYNGQSSEVCKRGIPHRGKTAHPAAAECAVDKPTLCRVVNLYNWAYANEGNLLCLGLGLLLLDLLGVAALRVCFLL